MLAVASGACAPPPPVASADDLQPAGLGTPAVAGLFVGCWGLTWVLGDDGSEPASLPDSVSLREGVVFGTRERLVSPATHPGGRPALDGSTSEPPWESRYRVNRWWVESDSLRIRFSDGERDEWTVSLGLTGEVLSGRGARAAAGPAEDRARARVTGARIGCNYG